jgi:hypothetical protein
LPANGECILRRNQESGAWTQEAPLSDSDLGKWRADVCSRRVASLTFGSFGNDKLGLFLNTDLRTWSLDLWLFRNQIR